MRIIAGKARGIPLKAGKNPACRPTTDRLKESLFNMIGDFEGQVLDLYSGSGALGLEALSRGADLVVLVENDRLALSSIMENIKAVCKSAQLDTSLAQVVQQSVTTYLHHLNGKQFDLILADPPYQDIDALRHILDSENLVKSSLEDALLVIEVQRNTDLPKSEYWNCIKKKDYSETSFTFWQKA